MKTTNPDKGALAGLVHNSQATIHNLAEHVRSTADKPRRLLDTKRRNDLLRELGQLHYDAHHSGTAPDQSSIDRLIAQLETERDNHTEHHDSGNGDQ